MGRGPQPWPCPSSTWAPGPSVKSVSVSVSAVAFHTSFPSAGRYRLFLDFRHGDVVRTAAFTVTVEGGHGH